jgi:hypothetical protein
MRPRVTMPYGCRSVRSGNVHECNRCCPVVPGEPGSAPDDLAGSPQRPDVGQGRQRGRLGLALFGSIRLNYQAPWWWGPLLIIAVLMLPFGFLQLLRRTRELTQTRH